MYLSFQPGGAGGGTVLLKAQQTIDVDGSIDVSGSNGHHYGSGGGSGGSLTISTYRFTGKGVLLCNGGSSSKGAGGGSGGRLAIHSNVTTFGGKINARGGASTVESGGPGTIYKRIRTGNGTKRSLEINNDGLKPMEKYMVVKNQDENGGKSWVFAQTQDDFHYDELRLLGGAHVLFVPIVPGSVVIEKLIGDKTGMVHVRDGDRVSINSAAIEFPSWFRVYEGGSLTLPRVVHLNFMGYRELFIEGTIGYIEEFRIGTGVVAYLGNKVQYACVMLSWFIVNMQARVTNELNGNENNSLAIKT